MIQVLFIMEKNRIQMGYVKLMQQHIACGKYMTITGDVFVCTDPNHLSRGFRTP
jgi:hypothetical protein